MKLFNDGWEFSLQPLHTTYAQMKEKEAQFVPVGLPHDWLICDAAHLYEDGTGWYRRTFFWRKTEELVFLRFDGVYMDSRVYVNGRQAFEWKYGYSAFEAELTPFLLDGENEIMVSADYQSPNSRWYSGAGIYRNVWLNIVPGRHLISDGIYFHAQKEEGETWLLEVEAETAGRDVEPDAELTDGAGILELRDAKWSCGRGEGETCLWKLCARVDAPVCWDVEDPHLYCLRVTLSFQGEILQTVRQNVGFRTVEFLPDEGIRLNGRRIKLNGVCEHHDLGCLGSAFHVQAMCRKLRILKEMGVNAVRTAHNMPAAEFLDLADEMGILVADEAFDMWERPKTTYDYARFFPKWYKKDVASWIRRDRNHPCVIMWSMGNEIYDTHAGRQGLECMCRLLEEVTRHDPKGNARATIGSNYMPWENTQKCADILKLIGYNYAEKYYDAHHKQHKDWIIYGSETASTVQSREIYHFPYAQPVLADEDEQCSALGNSTTSWGAPSPEACIIAERDCPYSCGQFLWSGFDYIGEPTPYHTRNSYFGQIDTAGFPKDSYYIYQASWTDYRKKPMVHLFPYWDFNEGQRIDVRACTNAPFVELFLNGKSLGRQAIDHAHGTTLTADWQVPYVRGELCAVAYDGGGRETARAVRHSFGDAARIVLRPGKEGLAADGEDLLFLEISMEDADGYPVENANNRVFVQIEGAGHLAGTDNGDSTDTDEYKCGSRRLFGGRLLAVARADVHPGELRITVSSPGLADAVLVLPVKPAQVRDGISPRAFLAPQGIRREEIPVRAVYLSASRTKLDAGHREAAVTARISPENASDRELLWSVVDDKGIPVSIAKVEADARTARVLALGDGTFRLRCMSRCGTKKVRIISQLEFEVEGMGRIYHDPYALIAGGLYDYSNGNIGNGNEHGAATPRGETAVVGYHGIDFGPDGSDEIHLPIFALSDEPYRIKIYEGMADEDGAVLIGDVIYQKPSVWNVYQEAAYRLDKRLRGVTDISFVTEDKIHLKGFFFERSSRAYAKLRAADCDVLYGDRCRMEAGSIRDIGNNVTIEFAQMDFGDDGARRITVCGSTPLEQNTIMLDFVSGETRQRRMLSFRSGAGEQTFEIETLRGSGTVRFLFLPGSEFDFHWFWFQK